MYCETNTNLVNRMQYSSTTLMYWILFIVLSNSQSAERQTIVSDWISDISNNTRLSGSIIDNDTEEHGSGFTLYNVTSSACTLYFNVNNET